MHCFARRSILSALLVIAVPASASIAPGDPLMKAMEAELARSFRRLKTAGGAPLYFLAYRVYDTEQTTVSATNGALDGYGTGRRYRSLDVEVRVGSAALDNTHRIRKRYPDFDPEGYRGSSPHPVPLENDEGALRAALWAATDAELKRAQKKLTEVKANKSVLAEEEDHSGDFSVAKPAVHYGKKREMSVDRAAWEKRAREVSAVFRGEPAVQNGSFYFSAARVQRTYANSEGTRIQDDSVQYRITLSANGISDDGMTHWLYDDFEVPSADLLPSDRELAERARQLAAAIRSLRVAPLAEPFAGPAILSPRAASVFFHEIFGHRVEGHRQKREDEGRTYKGKVGQRVMPEFITIVDDPLRERLRDIPLNGFYLYDDEGVAAEKVVLVDKGVFKGFLMSRTPIDGFPRSNGHGRSQAGMSPVARQGNLIVESSKRVPIEKLREMLREEIEKQQKPYGLLFGEIAGGFTMTQTYLPQSYKVLPLRVFRVYADGRPDEEVRGVDIVGTPLTTLERILATGDDEDVFNGVCGAESGWVPVSGSSPSLLVATIEIERREKSQERPPILPPPEVGKK